MIDFESAHRHFLSCLVTASKLLMYVGSHIQAPKVTYTVIKHRHLHSEGASFLNLSITALL